MTTDPGPARRWQASSAQVDFETYFNSARPGLFALLDTHVPHRVLEIGCGAAANLALLKQMHPDCHTTGIEVDVSAAERARRSGAADVVMVGDVRDPATIDFPRGQFDLLVLSHVLEHLEDPAQVLQRALGWLADGGRVLVALPNLRHYSVVVDLGVRGDFRYSRDGILDRTHLRFFTRRSAIRFLQEQGLEIVACAPDIAGQGSRLLSALSLHLADEFAAFAYNFCLRRAEACAS